jgi:cell division protein FtsZ
MKTHQNPTLSIRLFGIGNAGAAILEQIGARSLPGAASVVINADAVALAASTVPDRVSLDAGNRGGLGTGGDPARGREMAEEQFGQLKTLCEGAQVVFIFAGLGGGTGSGAVPVLARAAKECGALVLGFVALPFQFEGARRMAQAERAHAALREFADGVVCWPNQRIAGLMDASHTLAETLRTANKHIADGLCGLWRLLTRRGIMDVQFEELCSVLRDGHQDALFAAVEAEGATRAAVAVEKLLAHPVLENGAVLTGASAVLVGISAGGNLTMAEVGCVMEAVNSRCGDARVFVGASEDAALGDRLVVTLVAARPGDAPLNRARARSTALQANAEFETDMRGNTSAPRSRRHLLPPTPEISADKLESLAARQPGGPGRGGKIAKLQQGQLPLEIVSKSRVDTSEPTIHDGQDLDVPTFIRRNLAFN